MELVDLCPLETWAELETTIYERSGLNPAVYNIEGVRINGNLRFPNKLCPEIKAIAKGQTFICATAHMNLANMAKRSGEPVIEECDAGMLKLVVPIIVEGTYIGSVGGCGKLLDDGEVDTFLINKMTDIEEERIEQLSENIPAISSAQAEALADFIKTKVDRIIADYLARQK